MGPILLAIAFFLGVSSALDVDLDSPGSIRAAAKLVAEDLMSYYDGDQPGKIPGILPGPPDSGRGPYYWWQGGALWGTLIEAWHYTKDATYNSVIQEAMEHQTGPRHNFMPPNWTASLGNDDQAFWAMSAMSAAEYNFPNPPADQPQWLALAQAVFTTQLNSEGRDSACGGGLRWQAFPSNVGYDYKNSIANGCFFNLGARLARYTENQTYAQYATETWDWMQGVGLMDEDYNIYDGGHIPFNCTDINRAQFSYNAAIFLQGAAFMYNYTGGDAVWEHRVDRLLTQLISVFFPEGVAVEVACESADSLTCTTDMLSFKGYVHRWLAVTAQVAPFTKSRIKKILKSSTTAAVRQCTGGSNGRTCGFRWIQSPVYDGTNGAGQEMNVLGALVSLLVDEVHGPLTAKTGGTSEPDYDAGAGPAIEPLRPITTGDRAGAGILTALVLTLVTMTFTWMSTGLFEGSFP